MSSFTGRALFCVWFHFKKEQKLTSKISKLKHFPFKKYIESSLCYSLAWLAIITPGIRKCNSVSNHILILGKLFHIYNLIQIDWKRRILIAAILLAWLSNNWRKNFSLELLFRMKIQIYNMILMLKANQMFLKWFYNKTVCTFLWLYIP